MAETAARRVIGEDGAPTGDGITFYGTGWCPDSRRSRRLLDGLGISYAYVDLDQDAAALAWAARQNGGQRRIPTIAVGPGGPVLIEPSDDELGTALRDAGLI